MGIVCCETMGMTHAIHQKSTARMTGSVLTAAMMNISH